MNTNSLFRFLFFACLVIITPVVASAKQSSEGLTNLVLISTLDSTSKKQPVKPEDKKEEVKKPEIKAVPKSKRQIKPSAVGARIKIKIPVKIKPMIKRHLGLIRIH